MLLSELVGTTLTPVVSLPSILGVGVDKTLSMLTCVYMFLPCMTLIQAVSQATSQAVTATAGNQNATKSTQSAKRRLGAV